MAKKIGIAALVLLVAAALVLGVLWRRATALPEWYEQAALVTEDGSLAVDQDWVQIPLSEAPQGPRGAKPSAAEPGEEVYQLRNPHMRALKGKKNGEQLSKVVKQSRAVYKKKRKQIEAGAVINMSKLDPSKLSAKDRKTYDNLVEAFPALTGRDVYLGVEGDVRKEGDKIVFGPGAKLVIGKTKYSMRSAARQLGMSEDKLRRELGKELGKFKIKLPS